ncbi:MAG: hypothetical protein C0467_31575 [Planctomycetaceae bacterium]|nr:hypothetical protein [Planctomycetaceae bacterium]
MAPGDAPFRDTTAGILERTIRRIVLVVLTPGLHVPFPLREIVLPHGNVLPQFFSRLLIPIAKLVDPNCDGWVVHFS